MSTSRQSLLQAIQAEPAEATRYLVYADWCEENGEDDEARLYRDAIALATRLEQQVFVADALGIPSSAIALVECQAKERMPSRCNGESCVEWALRLVRWVRANRKAISAHVDRLRREEGWLAAAEAGDARALLAHPSSRAAISRLARGQSRSRYDSSRNATDYTSSRKAIAAAKATLAAREQRRQDRATAERARNASRPGRIRALWLKRLRARAVEMGEKYHRTVHKLYQSKYARVAYGRGGEEETDRERYSKGWHSNFGAATCRLAGARLDSEDHPTCVILENWRGTEVARLPLK